LQYSLGGGFEVAIQELTMACNILPLRLTPPWVATLHDREVRAHAVQLPQGMDHDNLSGSALLLAMLRPHIFCTQEMGVPLRLFGYPAPANLFSVDSSPGSASGPDNTRTNLVEALCVEWWRKMEQGDRSAERILNRMQDVWRQMRLRVDFVLRQHGWHRPISAHMVAGPALALNDRTGAF